MPLTADIVLGVYGDSGLNTVEASVFKTDGLDILSPPFCISRPYPDELRKKLIQACACDGKIPLTQSNKLNKEVTLFFKFVIEEMLDACKEKYSEIKIIGCPGQLINLDSLKRKVITFGEPQKLANSLKIPVASSFIQGDVRAGGKGRPLFPVFLEAWSRNLEKPLGIIVLGGITSVALIGLYGEIYAFDMGAGNILLDQWVQQKSGEAMDYSGLLAIKGKKQTKIIKEMLNCEFIHQKPPKSIDRNGFDFLMPLLKEETLIDGCATITSFIAKYIKKQKKFSPLSPKKWIVVGGGSYNKTLLREIKKSLKEEIFTLEDLGKENEKIEAMSYAFYAKRLKEKLPISLPTTTGVSSPCICGTIYSPEQ